MTSTRARSAYAKAFENPREFCEEAGHLYYHAFREDADGEHESEED